MIKMLTSLFRRGRTWAIVAAAVAVTMLGGLAGSTAAASATTMSLATTMSSATTTSSVTAAPPAYTVDDLGVFSDGGGATLATGINSAGDISGYGNHGTPGYTAFRWSNGTLTDLGSLGCGSHGNAINDGGTVVGFSNVTCAESDKAGFQTNGNSISDIGSLFARPTIANAVNASGQIVGTSVTDHGTQRAFISGPGGVGLQQVDLLGTEPPGAQTLEAHGVNTAGDVVGIAFFSNQSCGGHDAPFLYSGGTIQELSFLGGCGGVAEAINDSGVVVGFAGTSSSTTHAFSWDGIIHDLGVPPGTVESEALAINSSGTIVGSALAGQLAQPQAWVYGASGGMQLLSDLIDPSLGWSLEVATGINNNGQIAGYGAHNGAIHAFRLTPAPVKTLTGITVTPVNPTTTIGATQQFTAAGTYSDASTADITNSVIWSSSDTTVATINSAGLLSAAAHGMSTVTATSGSVSGSTTVTVPVPATLTGITITPANLTLPKGTSRQFTATGTYSDGTTADITNAVTWSSSKADVATITSAGQLAALSQGRTTVTAAAGTVKGKTQAIVNPPKLISLFISPANPNLSPGDVLQFTATGTYSDGTTVDLTTLGAWTSSDRRIARVGNQTGFAVATKKGTVTITYRHGPHSATTTLTVGPLGTTF